MPSWGCDRELSALAAGDSFRFGLRRHFVLDAVPHWDYPISSPSVDPKIGAPLKFDRALLRDAVTIGSDAMLGVTAALFLFASPTMQWVILLGAVGAMLPDVLQFIHPRFPHEPFRSLQRFHRWVHTDRAIKEDLTRGIGSQVLLVVAVVAGTLAVHCSSFSTMSAASPLLN